MNLNSNALNIFVVSVYTFGVKDHGPCLWSPVLLGGGNDGDGREHTSSEQLQS